jgi:choloylglycine hydrolase
MFKKYLISMLFVCLASTAVSACTGISLEATDGTKVVGRTVEWALSDSKHNKIGIYPRNHAYRALTPEGENGMAWQGKYGFVFMTAYDQAYGPDGMNEAGLSVGMYYLPGFASYKAYDKLHKKRSLSVGDFMHWMLSSFSSVDEVIAHLNGVDIIHIDDKRFGGAPLPFHWKISDASGRSIVIEIINNGEIKTYDTHLGVITNAPTYDWHLINLRNYIKLSPTPAEPLASDNQELSALGAGSGMWGLPGDFTPPSRFIRAAAFSATVRPLSTQNDAVFEAFRILDNFNIPLGSIASPDKLADDISGATQITSVSDLTNRIYYYHTMHNREIRKIDLKKIDFSNGSYRVIDDDADRKQHVKELLLK